MLDAIAGPEPTSPYWAPPPARPFAAEVGAPPGRLRIALTKRPFVTTVAPHADCAAAADDAARLLADLGHDVEEADLDIDGDAFARDFFVLTCVEIAALLARAEERLGPARADAASWRPTPRSSPRSAASRPALRAARGARPAGGGRARRDARRRAVRPRAVADAGAAAGRASARWSRAAPRRSPTTCWSRCASASCCACPASSRRRSGRCSRSSRSRRSPTSAASRR